MKFLTKIFGTRNDKLLRSIQPIVNRINALEAQMAPLSDDLLKAKTSELRERISRGETLDQVLPEAYAVCREAAKRALGQRHFDVQLLGGIVLHQGKIAEMRTGEGKTLTATLPSYLHGLAAKGSHVVTVNDYLAKRDADWMSAIYNKLGITVGAIVHGLTDRQRQESYACDITYGTNNEFGFDFLRDNMKTDPRRLVQRGHHFAIVDEVDSILIDEARTPLIISGPTEASTEIYVKVNEVIVGIQKDADYVVDEKSRHASFTEDGISKMERRLRIDNMYDPKNIDWLHHLQQALKAHILFKKDVDYVVRNGEILIVDEFTGRLMPGRRYSDGLHGALEAKEHVAVQNETQTLASITFQNYFRLYQTLSGMTGTADTEAVEFKKIYDLDVVVIPTNQKIARKDDDDVIYRTAREKFEAIAKDIEEAQGKGQPILVGTVSVEKSELLSSLLKKKNIPHDVLNAKNHAREASIIAHAGELSHVTIATNMAGRGTDISLGEGVREVGGLYVIGTERHDSRRIDNQLRGRSGRQGDPGKSKFFLSLDDDLMRIFASDRLSAIMGRLGMEEGESIVSPMVTRAIEKAQKRVEEQNFSSRKNVLEYDDVMNQQRQVVYKRRYDALMSQTNITFLEDVVASVATQKAAQYSPEALNAEAWDCVQIKKELSSEFHLDLESLPLEKFQLQEEIVNCIVAHVLKHYHAKLEPIGEENKRKIESFIYLQVIDQAWKEHLQAMEALKDSVSLRGYAQRDPLQEYKKEAFTLFSMMMEKIEHETTYAVLRMPAPQLTPEGREDEELEAGEDEKPLVFSHRAPPQPLQAQAQAPTHSDPSSERSPARRNSSQDDKNMLYFGAHTAVPQVDDAKPTTFKRETTKVGRNDPCHCGSGKKFKKCHGSHLG